jgi:hypothetical protein
MVGKGNVTVEVETVDAETIVVVRHRWVVRVEQIIFKGVISFLLSFEQGTTRSRCSQVVTGSFPVDTATLLDALRSGLCVRPNGRVQGLGRLVRNHIELKGKKSADTEE